MVGICFADKRKKSTADTLSDRAFSKLNVEQIYYISRICAVARGGGRARVPRRWTSEREFPQEECVVRTRARALTSGPSVHSESSE